jgi:hypothetical protein
VANDCELVRRAEPLSREDQQENSQENQREDSQQG